MIAIFLTAIINLNTGFLSLHLQDFFQDSPKPNCGNSCQPCLVMLLAGISIPTSGFLMQEYFQNPLAGPDILGITSVASLSVAFYIFFSHDILIPEFLQNSFLSLAAIAGSLLLMLVLLSMSNKFQDKSYLLFLDSWFRLLLELLFLCFSFMRKIKV
jgi:iron complex transport system permease protein